MKSVRKARRIIGEVGQLGENRLQNKTLDGAYSRKGKTLFVLVIAALIMFNFYVFMSAYPETSRLDGGGTLAKDFSAYYIGAWRLWHDPSHLYTSGLVNDGEYFVYPHPQAYKYLPSFLLLVSPLQFLGYHQGLVVFDVFQFALLPLIAVLLYLLLYQKGMTVGLVVSAIVLLPFPLPHWGPLATYFWQWAEGQAKVFETFLFLLSFYLGFQGKPHASGIVFAFSAFDPRFGLLGLPLFLFYNKNDMLSSVKSALVGMILSNIILFYPATGMGFLNMVFDKGLSTGFYAYAFIPLLTLTSLIIVNGKELAVAFSAVSERLTRKRRMQKSYHEEFELGL
jgi:hypothetical protein